MRYALVIGNARYHRLPELRNPGNDALMIGTQLKQLGFEVIYVQDASYRELLAACGMLRERLVMAGDRATAVVYYAGHGVQVSGQNFLLPVDMGPEDAGWLDRVSLSLDWVLHNTLQNHSRQTRIAIIDACRNNPFPQDDQNRARGAWSQSRGLAQTLPPPETLIAFSTSPGHVALDGLGSYGLYAAALAETMVSPSLPVERLFKLVRARVHEATSGAQIPWEHSSLIDEFCFVPGQLYSALNRGIQPAVTMQSVIQRGIVRNDYSTDDIKRKGHLIHKLKAKDSTGKWAYYFVLVEPHQEQAFLTALKSETTMNLEDYGKVIASNYGEEPRQEVKDFLKKHYGFQL